MTEASSLRTQAGAIWEVVTYDLPLATALVIFSLATAVLEGVSVTFLVPIIETAQRTDGAASANSELASVFAGVYDALGVPFEFEFIILGVAAVVVVRYVVGFFVGWMTYALKTNYIRWLQRRAFEHALGAGVAYYDRRGSDEVMNAIVKQSSYAGEVIQRSVQFTQNALTALMYMAVTFYLAPILTLVSALVLALLAVGIRNVFESGYALGDRVADANERIQKHVQAGTQGIRDVKLYGLGEEVFERFDRAVDQYASSNIRFRRNQVGMHSLYQLVTAVSVFSLVYVAVEFTPLTVAELGTFLFAMFRLAPRISSINNQFYDIQGALPHFVRTRSFIDELRESQEPDAGGRPAPETIEEIAFEDVSYAYGDEPVLDGVNFGVDRGEFVAFVGPSGAGKSTVVSLLARLYDPDDGRIAVDGIDVRDLGLKAWRRQLAVVRQDPYIFDETLAFNLKIGNRDASHESMERACEVARVDEFLPGLPNGYETELGDDGVRLSGGQRQRVAIARAVLSSAPVLVFDEATSDLDTSLEAAVHDAIVTEESDRTLIVVAHRLSTVRDADRIYVMEEGRIAEAGTHKALLERGGPYAELYAAQDDE